MGPVGDALDGIFTVGSALNDAFFLTAMCKTHDTHTLNIYFYGKDGALCDNGITVKGTNGQLQSNYVMHSVILTDEDGLNNKMIASLNRKSNRYSVWDIYLERDGEISQPGQTVEVTITIPDKYNKNGCKLYWVQDDGTLTLIDTELKDNTLVFYTDHFSYYAIVDEIGLVLGDVDGNGRVMVIDVTLMQRSIAQINIPFEIRADVADTDEDGSVTLMDTTYIQYWLAELKSNDRIGKPIA